METFKITRTYVFFDGTERVEQGEIPAPVQVGYTHSNRHFDFDGVYKSVEYDEITRCIKAIVVQTGNWEEFG